MKQQIGVVVIGRNEGNRLHHCLLSVVGEGMKKAEGRGQRAEGLHQLGIQTPPEQEPPNFQFGSVLKPLLPTIVAEGRNQNSLLPSASCPLPFLITIVYVDSGSTDGSVALARSLGVYVLDLDLSIPFTAARARNAGFEYLLQVEPNIEFVQFVDGDCLLVEGWLQRAVGELVSQPDVVVVCGRRREEFPANSIYNRLCDIEWDTPVGEAKACGGDAIMRVSALKQASGFNPSLIAGEEPELCVRLRQAGGKILRINAEMTMHDAQITRFGQWWKRSLRAGHAYAEGSWLHGRSPQQHWVKESRSIWFWGLFLPLLAIATTPLTLGLSILLLLTAYALLIYKVYKHTLQRGFKSEDALLYSLFCLLGKFPQVQGQIQFHISRLLKRQRTLVEYKSATSY